MTHTPVTILIASLYLTNLVNLLDSVKYPFRVIPHSYIRDFLAVKGLMLLYKIWVASVKKIQEYFVPQILFNTKERRIFVEV